MGAINLLRLVLAACVLTKTHGFRVLGAGVAAARHFQRPTSDILLLAKKKGKASSKQGGKKRKAGGARSGGGGEKNGHSTIHHGPIRVASELHCTTSVQLKIHNLSGGP